MEQWRHQTGEAVDDPYSNTVWFNFQTYIIFSINAAEENIYHKPGMSH